MKTVEETQDYWIESSWTCHDEKDKMGRWKREDGKKKFKKALSSH